MLAQGLSADGSFSDLLAGGDRDPAQNNRIQETASEVLRLRLAQSQHKQLESQLRGAAERLQQLPADKVLQLRGYLEQGLRPGARPGTLGSVNGGVDPESLLGLMECLCIVCDAGIKTRRQEDLLVATKRLMQDPMGLISQLVNLPAAPSSQSRRLAPYLLCCDSGWRGQVNEAGHCYETIRAWLSCYYQFSLISGQVQLTNDQLHKQESLLEELSKDVEPGPATGPIPTNGCGGHGGCGGHVGCNSVGTGAGSGPCNGASRPSPQVQNVVWRPRRSSSVQSNSSAGSRRSQSPAADRLMGVPGASGLGGGLGSRPSPRPGSGARRLPGAPPESPASTTLKQSSRSTLAERAAQQRPGAQGATSAASTAPHGTMTGRSSSPLHPCSSRGSLVKAAGEKENSPRAPAPRLGQPLPMPHSLGTIGSARAGSGGRGIASSGGAGGGGVPAASPRQVAEPPKTSATARRQNVPAVRARRSPSQDSSAGVGPASGSRVLNGAFHSRLTPHGDREARIAEHGHAVEGSSGPHTHRSETHNSPPVSSRGRVGITSSLARSRSLQSISEPFDVGATPPMTCRTAREPAAGGSGARRGACGGANVGGANGASSVSGASTGAAVGSEAPARRGAGRTSGQTPMNPRPMTSRANGRAGGNYAQVAGSGGTPPLTTARRQVRSSLPLPSPRRLSPSESASSLRGSHDAGSGGTGGTEAAAPGSALATSRSQPALDVRGGFGLRRGVRSTPDATPRPVRLSNV